VTDRPEELDDLRAAWRDLAPPALADSCEEAGPATRASVAWLRAAWAGLEVPEASATEVLGLRPRPAAPRALEVVRPALALAAAVLVAFLVSRRPRPARPEPAPTSTETTAPRIASLSPDHVELRSGVVTLVLVTGPPEREQAGPQGEPR
jgi:hypothetical protein